MDDTGKKIKFVEVRLICDLLLEMAPAVVADYFMILTVDFGKSHGKTEQSR